VTSDTVASAPPWWRARSAGEGSTELPSGLFHYVLATSWQHQLPLLLLTVAVFLLEVVPLELQRRVVNDVVRAAQAAGVAWAEVGPGGR
jgi:hypothetical protein